MSSLDLNQGFPQIPAPFVDPTTGVIQQVWLQLLITLWNRTGGAGGLSPLDGLGLAAFGEDLVQAPSQQLEMFDNGPAAAAPEQVWLFDDGAVPISQSDAVMLAMFSAGDDVLSSTGSVRQVTSSTGVLHASPATGNVVISLDIGTTGHAVPLLDGNNTWTGNATIDGSLGVVGALVVGSGVAVAGGLIVTSSGINVSGGAIIQGGLNLASGNFTLAGSGTVGGGLAVSAGCAVAGGLVVSGAFAPLTDNTIPCGLPGQRFTDIYAVSGSVNPSDITIKKNIKAITSALDLVLDVHPISWEWDEKKRPGWVDNKEHFGFAAQPLMEELARRYGERQAVVFVDSEGLFNYRPHEMVPFLWAAVRELAMEIRQ